MNRILIILLSYETSNPYLIGSRPKINLKKLSRFHFLFPETKLIDDLLFKNL